MVKIKKNISIYSLLPYTFFLSILLIIVSVLSILFFGINLSIDFTGGTTFHVSNIEEENRSFFVEKVSQTYTKAQYIEKSEYYDVFLPYHVTKSEIEDFFSKNSINNSVIYYEFLGPAMSSLFIKQSIIAFFISIVFVFFYICIRFDVLFAFGALFALLFDILAIFLFLNIFNIVFNLSSLSALLTIIGYSINDSMVIFDRVREKLEENQSDNTISNVINNSIQNVYSRIIITSFTTIASLLFLVFFGGSYFSSFAFIMIIGVVFGTFSSIFVALSLFIFPSLRKESLARYIVE